MSSAKTNSGRLQNHKPYIEYHQEFDLSVFSPGWPILREYASKPDKIISSFVNVFSSQDHFKEDWRLFTETEKLMSDWRFASYGGQCRDGACHGSAEVASMMRQSRYIWHTKCGGDGYGHVIHSLASVGRPPIIKLQYYDGKMARELFEDGKNCIAIDGLTPHEIVVKINAAESTYESMCMALYDSFVRLVNFDKEQEHIAAFLSRL